jgi:hypothetical protein
MMMMMMMEMDSSTARAIKCRLYSMRDKNKLRRLL